MVGEHMPRLPPTTAHVALLFLAAGCGGSGQGAGAVRLERVELMLVTRADLRRVVAEDPENPVAAGMLMPCMSTLDSGALPALTMTPPATIELDLPPLPPDAELVFAVGIDDTGYRGQGPSEVIFRVEREGEQLFREVLPSSGRVDRSERVWSRARVSVGGGSGGALRLSTSQRGERSEPPLVGFALLEVTVPFQVEPARRGAGRPNVVLILIDTLRADFLSCYGLPEQTSPRLDALAEGGVLFERALAPAPWTWPSTVSLLSGLPPPEHGIVHSDSSYVSHDITTLAEHMQAAGLATACFSTNPLISAGRNFDQGFDLFRERSWAHAVEILGEVEKWAQGTGDQRFFLYLHLTDPHTPYEPPADLAERWAPPPPEGWHKDAARHLADDRLKGEPVDEDFLARALARDVGLYKAEIAGVDRALGRFFDRLDAMGLGEDTLIVVTSDHGEEFLEHGMYAHHKQLFQESLHVPLILNGPGVPAGVRIDQLVEMRNLGSTVLRLAGLAAHDEFADGVDLLDEVERGEASGRPVFFSTEVGWWADRDQGLLMREESLYGVQLGNRRLSWARGRGEVPNPWTSLFDLGDDPGELDDLAGGHPDEVRELVHLIEGWLHDGEQRRPDPLGGDAATWSLLEQIGYVGGD